MTSTPHSHRVIEAVWRIEAAKIIAYLTRMLGGDIGSAEELAQDALLAALENWPQTGIPDNPKAWLMTTAKRRAIDKLRHTQLQARKHVEIAYSFATLNAETEPDNKYFEEDFGDDLLRLIFTSCHPVLSANARVALTLRLLGGLTTEEIARAYLTSETSIAQRIVRAKRTLKAAQVPFEVPRSSELTARLESVLEVIYLIFNEGYSATSGQDWVRLDLCEDALRLGRMLAKLIPQEAEVHGLVALLELQTSRLHARTGPSGEPILLLEQDRSRWDHLLIRRGLTALERAARLMAAQQSALGPYAIQAAIAAAHARASCAEATNWQHIAALYDALIQLLPSPIVALNRAVAFGMAYGPETGLQLVDDLINEPELENYPYLPSVRGDLLAKLGRCREASAEFERAAMLTHNERDRALMLARAQAYVR